MTLKRLVRQNFQDFWRFTVIGGGLTAVQILLQKFEVSNGWNILWLSPIQGTVLANIGLALNLKWTFKALQSPWIAAALLWNIQRLPHFVVTTTMFTLLLITTGLTYYWATGITAASVGIFSFAATIWWWPRAAAFCDKLVGWWFKFVRVLKIVTA